MTALCPQSIIGEKRANLSQARGDRREVVVDGGVSTTAAYRGQRGARTAAGVVRHALIRGLLGNRTGVEKSDIAGDVCERANKTYAYRSIAKRHGSDAIGELTAVEAAKGREHAAPSSDQ